MPVTHPFVSEVSDGADSSLVRPSNWNADHVCTGEFESAKVKLTAEGGIAIKLTNKTGGASVKGELVAASTGTDNAFIKQTSGYDSIGAVYEAGVADGSECWVVVSGRAQVLMKDTEASTRGYVLIASDVTAGRGVNIAVPTGTPTANDHWKECGHCIESKTGGTNVLAYHILHFN